MALILLLGSAVFTAHASQIILARDKTRATFEDGVSASSLPGRSLSTQEPSLPLSDISDTSTLTVTFADNTQATLAHSDALFGMNAYQTGVTGQLYYPIGDRNPHTGRVPGCTPFTDQGLNRKVVMIDRASPDDVQYNQSCGFSTKAANAEAAGAIGVVIADTRGLCGDPSCPWNGPDCSQCPSYQTARCQCTLPMMADTGGRSASIPAMLISQVDSAGLKILSSNPAAAPKVAMRWDIPAADGSVLMELWQDSVDLAAAAFRNVWQLYVPYLASTVRFLPHFYVIDGDDAGCTTGQSACSTQCINGGYYCAVDPDGDPDSGVSGGDVLMENLRSLCVFLEANKTFGSSSDLQWWAYAAGYQAACSDPSKWGATCSYGQMRAAGLSDAAVASIQRCVADSNATAAATAAAKPGCVIAPFNRELSDCNWTNTLLQGDMLQVYEMNIRYLPSVRVEGMVLSGSMSPPGILGAVCASFGTGKTLKGGIPAVCKCAGPAGSDVAGCLAGLTPPPPPPPLPPPAGQRLSLSSPCLPCWGWGGRCTTCGARAWRSRRTWWTCTPVWRGERGVGGVGGAPPAAPSRVGRVAMTAAAAAAVVAAVV